MQFKLALVVFSLLVMTSFTAAPSIGTFSSDTDRQIDSRSTEFTISAFNLGDKPVEVDVRSTELEDAAILHSDSMTIAPSEVTKNPEGDLSWFLMDDGRYVQTTEIPIEIVIDEARNTNSFSFDVDLQATSDISTDTKGAVQNLAQVRTYSYSVETTAPRLSEPEPPQDTGLTGKLAEAASNGLEQLSGGFGGLTGGSQNQEAKQSDSKTDSSSDGSDSSTRDGVEGLSTGQSSSTDSDNQQKSQTSNSATGNFLQSSGVNGVTAFLLLMMSASAVYLFRVI